MFENMLSDEEIKYYKKNFPEGTRIELINMTDPYVTIPSGTRGTVRITDDIGTVHVNFDNGRRLGIVPGVDYFRKLTVKEIEEEKAGKSLVEIINEAESKMKVIDISNSSLIADKER